MEITYSDKLTVHFPCVVSRMGVPRIGRFSCRENPRDRGAWWAAVYGVAQSRTRLKRLSSSKHGEGGKNGDNLSKKLCCLGVSREIGDTPILQADSSPSEPPVKPSPISLIAFGCMLFFWTPLYLS